MLEKTTYLVLILSAVTMAFVSVSNSMSPRQVIESPVAVGERLPDDYLILTAQGDSASVLGGGERTIVTFFSPTCAYCMVSLPTYRQIASERCDLSLTFVILDEVDTPISEWWSNNAWSDTDEEMCAEWTVGYAAGGLRNIPRPATPSHLVVAQSGSVIRFESGALLGVPAWLGGEAGS